MKLEQRLSPLLAQFKFNETANTLYHFVWGTYCDWYVELAKSSLEGEEAPSQEETKKVAAWALGCLLHYLHPFIPFVTEELWAQLCSPSAPQPLLMNSPWPCSSQSIWYEEASHEMEWLIAFVTQVRVLLGELNIPAATRLQGHFFVNPLDLRASGITTRIASYTGLLSRLLRFETLTCAKGDVPESMSSRER